MFMTQHPTTAQPVRCRVLRVTQDIKHRQRSGLVVGVDFDFLYVFEDEPIRIIGTQPTKDVSTFIECDSNAPGVQFVFVNV